MTLPVLSSFRSTSRQALSLGQQFGCRQSSSLHTMIEMWVRPFLNPFLTQREMVLISCGEKALPRSTNGHCYLRPAALKLGASAVVLTSS